MTSTWTLQTLPSGIISGSAYVQGNIARCSHPPSAILSVDDFVYPEVKVLCEESQERSDMEVCLWTITKRSESDFLQHEGV